MLGLCLVYGGSVVHDFHTLMVILVRPTCLKRPTTAALETLSEDEQNQRLVWITEALRAIGRLGD